MSAVHGGLEIRAASLGDAIGMDAALRGTAAVINAAGPFAFTVAPLVEAALRARLPYLDVAAEADIVAATMADYGERARAAGTALVPATAFFGGLVSLLATVAVGDWPQVDEITLAYALSSWVPTPGTRATIEAGGVRRGAAPVAEWDFPAPVGRQAVLAEFTTADSVTIPRHLKTRAITGYMTLAPLSDLSGPELSPAAAVDARGRSAQTFLLQAVARRGSRRRAANVRGQDIYAVSAPLVVEALRRLLLHPGKPRGVVTAAELGDACSYLAALSPRHLSLELADEEGAGSPLPSAIRRNQN